MSDPQPPTSPPRATRGLSGWSSRALTALRMGRELDEDVWERVVALWRESAGAGPPTRGDSPEELALRADVLSARALLLLVVEGPRLLGFAALGTKAAPDQRPEVRQLHVREGAPSAVVMTILLEAALLLARERDTCASSPLSPAVA